MKTSRQKLGKAGEEIAEKFLVAKGYAVITKNFRANRGEIDIICLKKDELVIVEVKSIRCPGFGSGEERISLKKRKKIIRTTYQFLGQHLDYGSMGIRFDLVVVDFSSYPAQIRHYEGAFWED
jgi:putative endonuclease